jgi:hypothetical protein
MAELADALALGASAARHAGSSPVPRTTILQKILNEFYKKGCQEKSSASTGRSRFFLEVQPTLFRYPEDVRLVVPFS